MKLIDFAKALGLALAILVLDLACAFAAATLWAALVQPGHPQAYYVAAAPAISTVSTRVCGPLLFLFGVWITSRRRPKRSPWLFALATFVLYLLLDGATVAFHGLYNTVVLITVALKLAGALAGAALAARKPGANLTAA
ncbi:MAG: hypothetical protein ACXWKY_15810 [Caulobacteraceae bacterium]